MAMVFSPSWDRSTAARRERPIRREISWVRPLTLPAMDSRRLRSAVAAGSMAYSAVSQPSPESRLNRGTPSSTDAVHMTRVLPNSTSTEPAGLVVKPRVILTARIWSWARPSARVKLVVEVMGNRLPVPHPLMLIDEKPTALDGQLQARQTQLDGPVIVLRGGREGRLLIRPRRDVGD